MPDTTIFTGGVHRFSQSGDFNYSLCRAGSSLAGGGTDPGITGQSIDTGFYGVWQTFLEFNTASIPDTSTVLTATLSLYGVSDQSNTDFTLEARAFDFGTFDVSDFVPGASLGSLTLLATYPTSSGFAVGAHNAFTDVAFPVNVNKTGFTRIVLCSDRHRIGNTPGVRELVTWRGPGIGGAAQDPKLTVTYTMAYTGNAVLVGVATFVPTSSYSAGGSATLQAVGLFTSLGQYRAGGEAALQAVARLAAQGEGIAFHDFTVYDCYLETAARV